MAVRKSKKPARKTATKGAKTKKRPHAKKPAAKKSAVKKIKMVTKPRVTPEEAPAMPANENAPAAQPMVAQPEDPAHAQGHRRIPIALEQNSKTAWAARSQRRQMR